MLKTISAALLAASVLAAPAMAAGTAKNPGTSHGAPAIKSAQVKPSVLNANAKMGRHHHKHYRHHRHHKKMGAVKAHTKMSFKPVTKSHSKVSFKHTAPIAKRG